MHNTYTYMGSNGIKLRHGIEGVGALVEFVKYCSCIDPLFIDNLWNIPLVQRNHKILSSNDSAIISKSIFLAIKSRSFSN